MKVSDVVVGLAIIAFGAAIALYGYWLPPMHGQRYGAGLFPILLGICAIVCGVATALTGWHARKAANAPLIEFSGWARDRQLRGNFLFALALIVGYVLLSDTIGFLPLSVAMLFALFVRLGVSALRAIVIAGVSTAIIYVMFARVLRVPLPRGLLEGIVW